MRGERGAGPESIAVDCLTPEAVQAFARKHDLALVALFGSAATGDAHARDLDLAVAPAGRTSSGFIEVARDLGPHFRSSRLDLAWLPDASAVLWKEATDHGRALYEKTPGLFAEFAREAARRGWDGALWARRCRSFVTRVLEGDWTLNRDLILQELASLADYLTRLEPLLAGPVEAFTADYTRFHTAERLLELMVECAATINHEVGQAIARTPATDYYSSFFILADLGWLSPEGAGNLGNLASLRNLLVHRYQKIALADLYQDLRRSLPVWREYLECVARKV